MQFNSAIRLAIAALAAPVGVAAAQPYAYVGMDSEARTGIVDLATNSVVGYLEAEAQVMNVAFVPGTNYMYTSGGGRLTKYDRVTRAQIGLVSTGTSIGEVVAHPDGQHVYLGFGTDRCVRGYSTSSTTLENTGSMPNNTVYLTISNDGSKIYATNAHFIASAGPRSVSVMDTSTYQVSTPIFLNGIPGGITLTPDGTKLYVGYEFDNAFNNGNILAVYDTSDNSLITEITVPAGGVRTMAFNPAGTTAYIAQPYTNQITLIDVATSTVITSWSFGNAGIFGLDVSRDGSKVYATDRTNDLVLVIDAATGGVTTSFHVGQTANSNPTAIKIGPDFVVASCPADLGGPGGLAGADGHLDNNDFIAFISLFFASDARADVGVAGGGAGHDGAFDNNDFIAFINAFFAGC